MHIPVLSREVIEYLAVRPEGIYLDATAGLGGHTAQIASQLTTGFVIANDRDAESLELARRYTAEWAGRIRFHHGRFSRLDEALRASGVDAVDGLLADLGVSRYQLTQGERGFSLLADGPVDMRMDRTQETSAYQLVNELAEENLADLIYRYGEERRARKIARAIVQARPIRSTLELARVIERAIARTGRLHPATQTFMALRIAVNRELEELDGLLELLPRLVKPGGRVVFLTFMSLEDRKVKFRFRELAKEGSLRILTKHVVRPTEQEIAYNPAARSAMLRAAERI
ncbi:MAG: 16S rRNA (cytosine(1402)-N(4))-methyltransferase RsmH [Bryobacteraceae bacterium]|nr:16S rRNA (cytosine(1402)-N(4))-methyltransferase RsmH [Bryobacteraceae bacterium]MDW8379356.1 16S rRNA (cytosine(1402)-N(4))-methyltransferase RsmH [Bryobacterales bacterium]